jgi:hypothetical protein
MESLSFRQAVSWKTTLIFFMNDRNKSVFFSPLALTLRQHSTARTENIFFSMRKSRMQSWMEKKEKEKLMTSYVMRIDFPSLTVFLLCRFDVLFGAFELLTKQNSWENVCIQFLCSACWYRKYNSRCAHNSSSSFYPFRAGTCAWRIKQLRSLTSDCIFYFSYLCNIWKKKQKVLWYFYRACIFMFISNITNHLVVHSELMCALFSSSYFHNFSIFLIQTARRHKGKEEEIHFYDVIKNSFHIVFLPACLFSFDSFISCLLILIAFTHCSLQALHAVSKCIFFYKIKKSIFFYFGVDDSDWLMLSWQPKCVYSWIKAVCSERNEIFGGTLWLCACMHKNAVACCQHFSRNKTNLKFIARQHSPCIYIVYLCI